MTYIFIYSIAYLEGYMCIKQSSVLAQVAMEATEVMDQVVLVNTQELVELFQNPLKQVFAVY